MIVYDIILWIMVSFQDVCDEYSRIKGIDKINIDCGDEYTSYNPSLYIPDIEELFTHYWSTWTDTTRENANILDVRVYKYMDFVVIFNFESEWDPTIRLRKDGFYCEIEDCINVYKIENDNNDKIFKKIVNQKYGYDYVYSCAVACYGKEIAKEKTKKYLLSNAKCNSKFPFYEDTNCGVICDFKNGIFKNLKNDKGSSDGESDSDFDEEKCDSGYKEEELNNTLFGYICEYIKSIHGTNADIMIEEYMNYMKKTFDDNCETISDMPLYKGLLKSMQHYGCIYDGCRTYHGSRTSMNITALFSHKYNEEKVYIIYHYEDEYTDGGDADCCFYRYENNGYTMFDFFNKSFRIIKESDFDLFEDVYRVVKDIKTDSVINYMYVLNKEICKMNGLVVKDEYSKLCDRIIEYISS